MAQIIPKILRMQPVAHPQAMETKSRAHRTAAAAAAAENHVNRHGIIEAALTALTLLMIICVINANDSLREWHSTLNCTEVKIS